MADQEKIIKAIDICLGHGKCNNCSYHSGANYSDQNCRGRMLQDVLVLLNEQGELLRKLQKDKDKLCLEVSEWKHKYHDRPLTEQEEMLVDYSAFGGMKYGGCPRCNARIDNLVNPKACGFCGQAVKWE